eukprot:66853_1
MGVTFDDIITKAANGYRKWLLYLEPHLFVYVFHFFIIFPNKLKILSSQSNYDAGGSSCVLEGTERLNGKCKGHGKHNNNIGNYLKTPHQRVMIETHGAPKRNMIDPSKSRKKSLKKKQKRKPWSQIEAGIQTTLHKFPSEMQQLIKEMNKIKHTDMSVPQNLKIMVEQYNNAKHNNKPKTKNKIELDLTDTALEFVIANDEANN